MAFPTDGHFLPGHGRAEKPEKRTRLAEMLEGQQVAVLYSDSDPGPTGSPVLALELTNGRRLAIMAARDRLSRYTARLVFRMLPPKTLWTPEDEHRLRFGRPDAERDPDPTIRELQQRVEGEVIAGLIQTEELAAWGGEMLALEFKGGARLSLAAAPAEGKGPGGLKLTADIVWAYTEPDRTHVWMP